MLSLSRLFLTLYYKLYTPLIPYQDKPLIFLGQFLGEARLPSSGSEYRFLTMLELIKAVSEIVLDMINVVYRDKPLIIPNYQGYVSAEAGLPSSGSEYKLLNTFAFIKAVLAIRHDKCCLS